MPGCQAPPPPTFQLSLPHDALTFGSLASIGWCSHTVLPVSASTAKIVPITGHSPPWVPISTMFLTASGAPEKPMVNFCELTSFAVPQLLAGLHVERDETAVDGADIDLAARDRDAAIVGAVRLFRDERFVELGEVAPFHFAGRAVEREHAAIGAGVIEHAVDRERHRLQAPFRPARACASTRRSGS